MPVPVDEIQIYTSGSQVFHPPVVSECFLPVSETYIFEMLILSYEGK